MDGTTVRPTSPNHGDKPMAQPTEEDARRRVKSSQADLGKRRRSVAKRRAEHRDADQILHAKLSTLRKMEAKARPYLEVIHKINRSPLPEPIQAMSTAVVRAAGRLRGQTARWTLNKSPRQAADECAAAVQQVEATSKALVAAETRLSDAESRVEDALQAVHGKPAPATMR